MPGSFTTTASDALKCKIEKDDPINRYALPDELMLKWAFYIQPNKTDLLPRGNVEANFGKKGGGREVYFENGHQNIPLLLKRNGSMKTLQLPT